jgi:DNA-binding response OmpR family regulator
MQILVAADDNVSETLLKTLLEKQDYDVVIKSDGKQAWQPWQNHHFPILITDWLMPKLNSAELCLKFRQHDRTMYTYIIMVTVMEGKQNYLEAIQAGVDDFITKPIDHEQLIARLRVAKRILNLQTEVDTLVGLLPICSYCKNIRKDGVYWERVENYLERNSQLKFSHGICPDCYTKITKPTLEKLRAEKNSK